MLKGVLYIQSVTCAIIISFIITAYHSTIIILKSKLILENNLKDEADVYLDSL